SLDSSLVNLETTNDINIELVTSEISEIIEVDQSDEQDYQVSVEASFLETINNDDKVRRRIFKCTHFGKSVRNQVVDLSQQ
ncbi:2082_t:CDS:2, partial [Cetraspora pellucida]